MNVEYSRQFVKAAYQLTGKYKESLKRIISEVKMAEDMADVTNCIKMAAFKQLGRIKMGVYRLVLILKTAENVAIFVLLLSRGEVYKKEHSTILRKKEKD